MTNAALLLLVYPEVIPMIEIVLMGGCIGTGNTHAVAEFNIQVCETPIALLGQADLLSMQEDSNRSVSLADS